MTDANYCSEIMAGLGIAGKLSLLAVGVITCWEVWQLVRTRKIAWTKKWVGVYLGLWLVFAVSFLVSYWLVSTKCPIVIIDYLPGVS